VLTEFISPNVSAKLYVFLLGAALFSGIVRYVRYHSSLSMSAVFIIAFVFTLNMHFLSAYLNFVTGIAFALHAITTIRKRNWEANIIVMACALLVCYLCHFFALFIFGLYLIVYIFSTKEYRTLARLGIAGIPMLALFVHYFISKTLSSADSIVGSVTFIETILWKSFVFFAPGIPFHQFKWVTETSQPIQWMNMLFCLSIASATGYALFRSIRENRYSFSFWLFVPTFIILLALPSYLSGNMLPGERLSLFAMLNALILISEYSFPAKLRGMLLALGIAICVAITVQVVYNTRVFNQMVSENSIPKDATTLAYTKREGTNPFIHFHIYQAIQEHQHIPLFTTGLITYRGANPATPDGK
jgi:hypothetical protein